MLKFEWRRIYANKKNPFIFLFIVLISVYFLLSGLRSYERFQDEKTIFKDYEKRIVSNYLNYTQYAGHGFRILLDPSPLIVFFKNSNILQEIESNVDIRELARISARFKGKKLFVDRGYFKDFSGFIFLTGSLLMIYMGVIGLKNAEYLKFNIMFMDFKKSVLKGTIVRLFLLNLFFFVLFLVSLFLVKIKGIHFSRIELNHYLYYVLFFLVTMIFFYLAGMILAVIFRFKKVAFLWMFICWIVFMFLIPELSRVFIFDKAEKLPSNESADFEKIKFLMNYEYNTREYMADNSQSNKEEIFHKVIGNFFDTVHRFNQTQELNLNDAIKNIVHSYEYLSAFIPTQFYYFLIGEISSKGYHGYTAYSDYVIKSQEKFARFYINKRYILKESKVESFVKGSENIFKSRSHLPGAFWLGVTITVFYCSVLFFIAYFRLKKLLFEP